MIAAIEGGVVDRMPVAPMFWGSEYSWRLVSRPMWETTHGPAEVFLDRLAALDARHQCDWLLVMFPGTGKLNGKHLVSEQPQQAVFIEDCSGDEWLFDKRTRCFEPTDKRNHSGPPSVPRNRAEAQRILESPNVHFSNPMIAPTESVRALFPDRFLCGAVPGPFSHVSNYLGFHGRAQLVEDDPELCAWMAEAVLGDVEALASRYASDGLDAAWLVDWWAPADLNFYQNWIAPLHKRIATALADVGLKSIFYLHRGDIRGSLSLTLNAIADLGFDAFAFEESEDGVDMNLAEARSALGAQGCIIGNLDPQLLLANGFDLVRRETLRQVHEAGMPLIVGTGSAVLDNTDPSVLDCWISLARNCPAC